MGVLAYSLLLVAASPTQLPATRWRDSTEGVHSFLVFDYHLESNLTHSPTLRPSHRSMTTFGALRPKRLAPGGKAIRTSL